MIEQILKDKIKECNLELEDLKKDRENAKTSYEKYVADDMRTYVKGQIDAYNTILLTILTDKDEVDIDGDKHP